MLTEALLVTLIAAAPPGTGTERGAHRIGRSLVITLGTGREVVLADKPPPEHEADILQAGHNLQTQPTPGSPP